MNSSGRRIVSFMLAGLALLPVLFTVSCRNREDISHKDDYQQAYVYAYPMIASYKTMYQYFIDKSGPQYKAPFNTVANDSQVVTPKDTAVVAPDTDTLSSMMQVDLRVEPIVFCVPDIERSRFYDVQLIDMYTYNYGYVGTRVSGNDAGCYMVAGPGWKGVSPEGIRKVFQSETQFSLLIYRTQLFGPKDIDAVKKIQAGYTAQPMSQYAHQP